MPKTQTVQKEYTVELQSGKSVTAEMNATFSYDPNYGADADGHRGIGMWFVEEMYPIQGVPDEDDEGNSLTPEERKEALIKLETAIEEEELDAYGDAGEDYDESTQVEAIIDRLLEDEAELEKETPKYKEHLKKIRKSRAALSPEEKDVLWHTMGKLAKGKSVEQG